MTPNAAQTTHHVLAGMTLGGGALEWLTINSSALTAMTVVITGIVSLWFGYENKKSMRINANANKTRNTINRRDIATSIIEDVERAGKSQEYIEDLKQALRN